MTIQTRESHYNNPKFIASKPRPITVPAGFTVTFVDDGGESPGELGTYASIMTDVAGTMTVMMPLDKPLNPNKNYTVTFRVRSNMTNAGIQPVIRPVSATSTSNETKDGWAQIAPGEIHWVSESISLVDTDYSAPFAGFYLRSNLGTASTAPVGGYIRVTDFYVTESLPFGAVRRTNEWFDPVNTTFFSVTNADILADRRTDGTYGRVLYVEKLSTSTNARVPMGDWRLASRLKANTKYTLKFKVVGSAANAVSMIYRPVGPLTTTDQVTLFSPLVTTANTILQKEVTFTTLGSSPTGAGNIMILLASTTPQFATLKIWDALLIEWVKGVEPSSYNVFSGDTSATYDLAYLYSGSPGYSASWEYDLAIQVPRETEGSTILPFSNRYDVKTVDINYFENPRGQDTTLRTGTDYEVQTYTDGTFGIGLRVRKSGNFAGSVVASLKQLHQLKPSTTYTITMDIVLRGISGTSLGLSMAYRPSDTGTTGVSATHFRTVTKDAVTSITWTLTTSNTLPGADPQGITFTLGTAFTTTSMFLLFQNISIREGSTFLPFWDADMPGDDPDEISLWEGVRGQSRSLLITSTFSEERKIPRVGITIFTPDHLTPLVNIPRFRNPMFLEERNRDGGGAFEIRIDDNTYVNHRADFVEGNLVRMVLPGKVAWFEIQRPNEVSIDEHNNRWVKIAGPGPLSWLRYGIIYPGLIEGEGNTLTRYFNFGSPPTLGTWYNASDWTTTPTIVTDTWQNSQPADWPLPSVDWIWNGLGASPGGSVYFRRLFTLSGNTRKLKVWASARDAATVLVDGATVMVIDETNAYQKTFSQEITLSPGTHYLAIHGRKNATGSAGVIAMITEVPPEGTAIADAHRLVWTNAAGWTVNPYPATAPGWTPGQVLAQLLLEARNRGVDYLSYFNDSFTGLVDSASVAWPSRFSWQFAIGSKIRDAVIDLTDMGVDTWIDDNMVLRLLNGTRGDDLTVPTPGKNIVIFAPGFNVKRSAAEADDTELVNSLLLNTAEGTQEVLDTSDSSSLYGRREGYASITNVTKSVSAMIATQIFTKQAKPQRYPAITIMAVPDHTPWVDFQVGDWVLAPADEYTNQLVARKVESIAFTEDSATGDLVYSIELDSIAQAYEERFQRWLTRNDAGSLGGSIGGRSGMS